MNYHNAQCCKCMAGCGHDQRASCIDCGHHGKIQPYKSKCRSFDVDSWLLENSGLMDDLSEKGED